MAHRKKQDPRAAGGRRGLPAAAREGRGHRHREGKGDVCTRLPPAARGRAAPVAGRGGRPARARDILELGARLLADGVELVVMESTSRLLADVVLPAGIARAGGRAGELLPRPAAGRAAEDRPAGRQWLARLAEMGLLRPSFVPPPEVRALRDLARARAAPGPRPRPGWQRLEKLLEGALIKLSSELSSLAQVKTARLILDALAGGERDPKALAALALGPLRARRGDLEAALDGHDDRRPPRPADPRSTWTRSTAWAAPSAPSRTRSPPPWRPSPPPGAWTAAGEPLPGPRPGAAVLPAAARLAEVPGVTLGLAAAIIAETGLDMSAFPTAAHLVSWAGLAPVARQSGPRSRKPKKGQGNAYLKGYCTQAANGAARTDSFLGERLGRLARRIGPARAQCAVARSILVIVWHLLRDPAARYADLGADWHDRKAGRDKKIRTHIRQIHALGFNVTITPAPPKPKTPLTRPATQTATGP